MLVLVAFRYKVFNVRGDFVSKIENLTLGLLQKMKKFSTFSCQTSFFFQCGGEIKFLLCIAGF